jgi:hypothetical protein
MDVNYLSGDKQMSDTKPLNSRERRKQQAEAHNKAYSTVKTPTPSIKFDDMSNDAKMVSVITAMMFPYPKQRI